MNKRELLINYAIEYDGNFNKIKFAFENNLFVKDYKCFNAITIFDEIYPKRLLLLKEPPLVLFYKGNINLLKHQSISIIGSRYPTEYGIRSCKMIVNNLKKRYVIVSGLALGIDGLSHELSLDSQTIGVLGCGVDVTYPLNNAHIYNEMRKNHLIISEYPNTSKPLKEHFPRRNRIIAALSEKLIVVEAKIKSGTMITVNFALELGKEIYALPHEFDSLNGEGCNMLINDGANILLTSDIDLI